MKNWLRRCVAIVLASALVACGGSDEGSAAPPSNVTASAGDGWIQVNWNTAPGLEYWVFTALDPGLTTLNWLNLLGGAAFIQVAPPLTLCSLTNGVQRYFTVNARSGSDPGGPGSPVVSATPRAAATTWTVGPTLGDNLAAIGFGVITTCLRTGLPTGVLNAVGAGSVIYTSNDAGATWTRRAAPTGFSADLYAVANFTANPNATSNLSTRAVAVGANGAALTSTDGGVTWTIGRGPDPARATLRAMTVVAGGFVAVGDGGSIQSTPDGVTWTALASNTGVHLRGIAFGNGRYIAVGDGGTIVTSTDSGVNWSAQAVAGAGNLRAVAYGSNNNNSDGGGIIGINTFVAVAHDGTAAVSSDGGATWSAVTIPGAGELVGIAYITRFVAIDHNGNAFASNDGRTWSAPVATGRSGLAAITSNGYGYFAVGDGGVTTKSF